MDILIDSCRKLIPLNAMAIHNILNNKGFDTYFVGGALRDYYLSEFLGKKISIKDWDIVTAARYNDVKKFFNKALRINENGRIISKTGRTKILIPDIETTAVSINNQMFEVTPMHSKENNNVTFITDIYNDLRKRDFTINTIAYSPKLGTISSFLNDNGKEINATKDIENQLIKSTGNPKVLVEGNRYSMIRAILVANKLNFEIENDTFEAIRDNIFKVNEINKGKMSIAFEKLLMSKSIEKLEYMITTGLLSALCVDFDRNLQYSLIELLMKVKKEQNEYKYYDRLKYIYVNFPQKTILLNLLKEFGVKKDILENL